MAVVPFPDKTTFSPNCPRLPAGGKAITPSDVDTFDGPVAVYVGGAGDVMCSPENGQPDVAVTVPAGGLVPFLVKAVKATGTTASKLVAVY